MKPDHAKSHRTSARLPRAECEQQVRAIKTMAEYVAQIKRVGTGHGVWDLDKKLEEEMQAAA